MNNLLMNLGNNKIVMSALGAMMRGENPQAFIRNLASTNPKLQGLDLDNLEETAKGLCDQNGIDMNQLAGKIQEFANSNTQTYERRL